LVAAQGLARENTVKPAAGVTRRTLGKWFGADPGILESQVFKGELPALPAPAGAA
jgi:hypothetical protein